MANTQNTALANYETVRQDFVTLVSSLSDANLETVVPATPDWTVLDVVRHVVHLAECTYRAGQPALILSQWSPEPDVAAEGALLRDDWTASGVADRADRDLSELLAEWDQTMAQWRANADPNGLSDDLPERAARLKELGGEAPPWWPSTTMAPPAMDLLNHEWDVRDITSIDSHRNTPAVSAALTAALRLSSARRQMRGQPVIAVEISETGQVLGDPNSSVRVRGPEFELMRAFAGRRTANQVDQLEWTGPNNLYEIVNPWTEPTTPLTW